MTLSHQCISFLKFLVVVIAATIVSIIVLPLCIRWSDKQNEVARIEREKFEAKKLGILVTCTHKNMSLAYPTYVASATFEDHDGVLYQLGCDGMTGFFAEYDVHLQASCRALMVGESYRIRVERDGHVAAVVSKMR